MFSKLLRCWQPLRKDKVCPLSNLGARVDQFEENLIQLSKDMKALRQNFDLMRQGFNQHTRREEEEFRRIVSGVEQLLHRVGGHLDGRVE